jgi:hypothetical protein
MWPSSCSRSRAQLDRPSEPLLYRCPWAVLTVMEPETNSARPDAWVTQTGLASAEAEESDIPRALRAVNEIRTGGHTAPLARDPHAGPACALVVPTSANPSPVHWLIRASARRTPLIDPSTPFRGLIRTRIGRHESHRPGTPSGPVAMKANPGPGGFAPLCCGVRLSLSIGTETCRGIANVSAVNPATHRSAEVSRMPRQCWRQVRRHRRCTRWTGWRWPAVVGGSAAHRQAPQRHRTGALSGIYRLPHHRPDLRRPTPRAGP